MTFPFPLMRSSEEEALESPRAEERPLAQTG